jgi:hypothetical protein
MPTRSEPTPNGIKVIHTLSNGNYGGTFIYRPQPDGTIQVDTDAACGKFFMGVVVIHEPTNENPQIEITSGSGIIGSRLLRRLLQDVDARRHINLDAPRLAVRVVWGSQSTRDENPELAEGDLYEFDTEAELNAFTEALANADGWAEWDITDPEEPNEGDEEADEQAEN